MKKVRIAVIISFTLLSLKALAQSENNSETRQVVINYNDSSVNTSILNVQPEYKPLTNRYYYWYRAENLQVNKGGYSGYLLNGDYTLYDKNLRLIEKGTFDKGLKTGSWKRWTPQGVLLSEINWKEGLLDGISLYYNANGSVFRSDEYANGKKDGLSVHFENDSLVKQYYKNGEIVTKQPVNKHQKEKSKVLSDTLTIDNQ